MFPYNTLNAIIICRENFSSHHSVRRHPFHPIILNWKRNLTSFARDGCVSLFAAFVDISLCAIFTLARIWACQHVCKLKRIIACDLLCRLQIVVSFFLLLSFFSVYNKNGKKECLRVCQKNRILTLKDMQNCCCYLCGGCVVFLFIFLSSSSLSQPTILNRHTFFL